MRVDTPAGPGRVEAVWCGLNGAREEYARVYLDAQLHGTPWLVVAARELGVDFGARARSEELLWAVIS